jgi:hypothetical protein
MDDALRRLMNTVDQYGIPEQMIQAASRSLVGMPAEQRVQTEIHALVDAILLIADDHAGGHDDCVTCSKVANAVATAMGVIRAENVLDLKRAFDSNG